MCSVPSRVVVLIETFDRDVEAYCSQQYNEAQLRREFIDPFFEKLGWDVTNKLGYAQAYKDDTHESVIKVVGTANVPEEKTRIRQQIDSTDKQIDKLVYDLYGLTERKPRNKSRYKDIGTDCEND